MVLRLLVVAHDHFQGIECVRSTSRVFIPHSSPHIGLLSAAVNAENIKLKLTLTRLSPLALASTE